ncbi:putative nucleotide- alpha-beta [Rosellinia necatrix]|uniref:Putative nucleotide-alpha-beta n=1 Tax=Rosellinia necatrix TaxID=77044 RepID=A0A1S7UKT8_ROSNE|nr:putative nucleotide- alpha-beta [Rosellinia necatrix]
MATANTEQPGSPVDPTSTSKKRKTELDEIEVDLDLPEPPSKKAKRLLKKGKPLPVKPTSDNEADDGLGIPKTKDGKEKKRSDYGIWIGNLPFTLTRVELFKWLVDCSGGTIKEENITRVNLPTNKDRNKRAGQNEETPQQNKPQNKGFAYVDFDAEGVAVAAMALTETELEGRKVLIKNATSFEGRPQKEAAAAAAAAGDAKNGTEAGGAGLAATRQLNNASRKIYVGNMSFQVTEDDLRTQFEKCGEIEWVKVATFEDSGKCKGYGWVKFKEAEAAAWAVKGFVKIKEEVETEDDFRDAGDDDDDDDDEGKDKQKKFQMRKWWVNRLHGRELKIELAEDDQVRYKKRYGKGAPGRNGAPQTNRRRPERREGEGGRDDPARAKPTPKPEGYGDKAVLSYKTGAVQKSEGKKTTFD